MIHFYVLQLSRRSAIFTGKAPTLPLANLVHHLRLIIVRVIAHDRADDLTSGTGPSAAGEVRSAPEHEPRDVQFFGLARLIRLPRCIRLTRRPRRGGESVRFRHPLLAFLRQHLSFQLYQRVPRAVDVPAVHFV